MRQQDQVHFSTQGGDRLSWEVLERLGELVDLSGSRSTPPPSLIAPESVHEREELPPARAEIID